MERQLLLRLYRFLLEMPRPPESPRCRFSDLWILLTYFWAVLCDRPVSWACQAAHWPRELAGFSPPSPATMSRRLRTREVQRLMLWLLGRLQAPLAPSVIKYVDTFPLRINFASTDRQARVGRAATGQAKGYKLHWIMGQSGAVEALTVVAMNHHEQTITPGLLGQLPYLTRQPAWGFLIGDNAYDGNRLYAAAAARRLQLIAAPRHRRCHDLAHMPQHPARIRGRLWAQSPPGRQWLRERFAIDRRIGMAAVLGGGLGQPPGWVRTLGRVRMWTLAKLIGLQARERFAHAA